MMKTFLFKFSLIVVGAALGMVVALISAEIMIRNNPVYNFESMAMVLSRYNNHEWKHCFRSSHLYGYELVPRSSPEINSFGMRDKEYPLKKEKGVFRVLLLGDSITQIGRWSDELETALNKNIRCEILNAAVSGWGLYEYQEYLKNNLERFDPDLVLIGFCLNDIPGWGNVQALLPDGNDVMLYSIRAPEEKKNYMTLKIQPFLYYRSALYRAVVTKILLQRRISEKKGIEARVNALLEMKTEGRGRVLGILFPYLKPLREYNGNEKEEYRLTEAALKTAGIEYLDLTQLFNEYGDGISRFRLNPEDKIHYNDEANHLKTSKIYEWILPVINEIKEAAIK